MPSTATLRVLIVDDERLVADTLGLIVQSSGHVVRVAYSGEEATKIAEELQPHAAISDVRMPGMSGVELAAWLGEHYPECRVLLVSGNMEALDELEAAEGGRQPYILSKPVAPHRILSFLSDCVPEPSQAE